MKPLKYLFLSLLACLTLTACGGEEEGKGDDTPKIPVNLIDQTVAEGATISPATAEITFTFSCDVTLNASAAITLNTSTVMARTDKQKLIVEVSLDPEKSYTLTVPGRAVTNVSGEANKGIVLRFKTEKASQEPLVPTVTNVATSLHNPKATDAAKRVYQLLYDNYGKKTLSGVMGEVAWGSAFYDAVAAQAGKYPAIIGFDYIHLAWSPANWIDYGNITPVETAWNNGEIPAITWHWNQKDASGNWNCDKNTFDPSKILTPGTNENTIAEADVAEMAESLKKIQDKGIAMIFRPFHEAAGDYVWGPWFWWGSKGQQVTKELWIWLHDKLTNEYGINNLIWTWTMQTSSEGKLAGVNKLIEGYPGDNYVDIVGCDLYDTSYTQKQAFDLCNKAVDGKKMVALCETGNVSVPTEGAMWSYFMGWYEWGDNGAALGLNWNKKGEWKTVLSSPLVLNRGDFNVK